MPENDENYRNLTAPAEAVLDTLAERASEMTLTGSVERVGVVVEVGDGIAIVSSVADVGFNELLVFEGGERGIVFDLGEERIGCVLLDDCRAINAGDVVRRTRETMSVPVGEAMLGRVVDALGRPLDAGDEIDAETTLPVERPGTPIISRQPVNTPLHTGIKAIDSMIPVGRGQRELIVGDRSIGKTAVAIDTILNQRDSGVICVYVSIGQKTSTIASVVAALERFDAMEYTVVVVTDANDPPGLQYIAPYAGCTIGEYFMEKGRDVLLIYDDLTKHAQAYRQLSLLLRRPPGREAYPGDIFFIHSRLLERATHMIDEKGGGSLSALPIVETQAGNLSAYIATNLISITDGQIYLAPELFHRGIKPPVDIGKSVSRVGGKAQLKAMRQVAKNLRLDYTQFEELEIFSRFGAKVDVAAAKKIERGRRIREILKQPRYAPMPAEQQVLILLATARGVADRVPIERLGEFQQAIIDSVPQKVEAILKKISDDEELSEEDIDTAIKEIESAVPAELFTEEPPGESEDKPQEDDAGGRPTE